MSRWLSAREAGRSARSRAAMSFGPRRRHRRAPADRRARFCAGGRRTGPRGPTTPRCPRRGRRVPTPSALSRCPTPEEWGQATVQDAGLVVAMRRFGGAQNAPVTDRLCHRLGDAAACSESRGACCPWAIGRGRDQRCPWRRTLRAPRLADNDREADSPPAIRPFLGPRESIIGAIRFHPEVDGSSVLTRVRLTHVVAVAPRRSRASLIRPFGAGHIAIAPLDLEGPSRGLSRWQ
jgi:hypothetical protein